MISSTVSACAGDVMRASAIHIMLMDCSPCLDEGPGFKERDTEKIFNRFYSNRPDKFGQHSGLGLNIVKNLVELHKATIRASNRVDKNGANLEIIFPKT